MTQIELKVGDITDCEVDALVNPANNDLILGGGVSGAIRKSAGTQVQEECNNVAPIPLGEAVVTGSGKLRAKYIIHAAVMPLGLWADARSIRNSVINSLKRAVEKGMKSIAFPALGTGAGNFPIDKSAMILFEEVFNHIKSSTTLEKIYVILYDQKSCDEFNAVYERMRPKEQFNPTT